MRFAGALSSTLRPRSSTTATAAACAFVRASAANPAQNSREERVRAVKGLRPSKSLPAPPQPRSTLLTPLYSLFPSCLGAPQAFQIRLAHQRAVLEEPRQLSQRERLPGIHQRLLGLGVDVG